MELGTHFNSKLLLFGEYGLMFDAMALSVPFSRFSGCLAFDADQSHQGSTMEIRKFLGHLKSDESFRQLHFPIDLETLENDLGRGLYFSSNIPQQYGVGSSGALVAALFSRYAVRTVAVDELSTEVLKADFVLLESYFHGRSSGLDPLISFVNRPLLIDPKKQVHAVRFDLAKTGLPVALIDTRQTGATGPLVQHFIDRFNSPEFKLAFEKQFIPANNGCIDSLLHDQKAEFFLFLEQLIWFQLVYFRRMIPGEYHLVVQHALKDKVYLKLLGSGGGGFLLAFAETENDLKNWAEKCGVKLILITGSEPRNSGANEIFH